MNTKPKAAKTKKSQIKIADLKPKKDVKGGSYNGTLLTCRKAGGDQIP